MKCDETKPCCYSCTSTGRTCDGYSPKSEPPVDLCAASGVLTIPLSTGFLVIEKESRSFNFFQQKTAPQLSEFLGDDYWERLLLQAAHHEPSILHAVLAIGSLHAKIEQENDPIMRSRGSRRIDDFALKNYSQAINDLIKPLASEGRQAIDVCLLCSILFACLEVRSSDIQAVPTLNFRPRQCRATTAQRLHMSKAA